MKQITKDFLKIAGGIFSFLMLTSLLFGVGKEILSEGGFFIWLLGSILTAFIFSAIYVYGLRPVGRYFKKKFVSEDKDEVSHKEVFKELFLGK
jgi:hypothetical protein